MSKYNELLLSQIQLANELSSILDDEKSALESHKIEMLVELSTQKATLLENFNHLENERENIIDSFNAADPETKQLQSELVSLIEQCVKQNHINATAIGLSQNRVRNQLGLLLGEDRLISLYSAKGKVVSQALTHRHGC